MDLEKKTVSFRELVHRTVDSSYEDLYHLSRRLQMEPMEARRPALLSYINTARQRFMLLTVLLKWAVQLPLIEKCEHHLLKGQEQTDQLNETNDRLFFMHADLNRAKERLYDITTAIDVFFSGTYTRLPSVISQRNRSQLRKHMPREQVIQKMEEALHLAVLEADIPSCFTSVKVLGGFLICAVEGEFEVVLTLNVAGSRRRWRVVDVAVANERDVQQFLLVKRRRKNDTTVSSKRVRLETASKMGTELSESVVEVSEESDAVTLLQSRTKLGEGADDETSKVRGQLVPSRLHMHHLKNVIQRRLETLIPDKDEGETSKDQETKKAQLPIVNMRVPQSKEVFRSIFEISRHFCASLGISTLNRQAKMLESKEWKGKLVVKLHPEDLVLDFCFWQSTLNASDTAVVNKGPSVDGRNGKSTPNSANEPANCRYLRSTCGDEGRSLLSFQLGPADDKSSVTTEFMKRVGQVTLLNLNAEKLLISAVETHASLKLLQLYKQILRDDSISLSSQKSQRTLRLRSGRRLTVALTQECVEVAFLTSSALFRLDLFFLVDIRTGRYEVSGAAEEGPSGAARRALQSFIVDSDGIGSTSTKKGEEWLISFGGLLEAIVEQRLYDIVCEAGRILTGVLPERSLPFQVDLNPSKSNDAKSPNANGPVKPPNSGRKLFKMCVFFPLSSFQGRFYYLVVNVNRIGGEFGLEGIDSYVAEPELATVFKERDVSMLSHGSHPERGFCMLVCRRSKTQAAFITIDQVLGLRSFPFVAFSAATDADHSTASLSDGGDPAPKDSFSELSSTGSKIVDESDVALTRELQRLRTLLAQALASCREKMLVFQIQSTLEQLKCSCSKLAEEPAVNDAIIGGKLFSFELPPTFKARIDPLRLHMISIRTVPGGGWEFHSPVAPSHPLPVKRSSHGLHESEEFALCFDGACRFAEKPSPHQLLQDGSLLLRYPAKSPQYLNRVYPEEQVLLSYLNDLMLQVKPMVLFGKELAEFLKSKKEDPLNKKSAWYHLEHLDPFKAILSCTYANSRLTVAGGASPDGSRVCRVMIRVVRDRGFVVNFSKRAGLHSLSSYLQSSLNIHKSARRFVETLEMVTYPLDVISSAVEDTLQSAYYHRQDFLTSGKAKNGKAGLGKKIAGKKGGKGMQLNYKVGKGGGKGMQLGYKVEPTNSAGGSGGEDKSFLASKLLLIPRAQNRVKLSYASRCAVDMWFLDDVVRLKNGSSGVEVPSLKGKDYELVPHHEWEERIGALLSEMAGL